MSWPNAVDAALALGFLLVLGWILLTAATSAVDWWTADSEPRQVELLKSMLATQGDSIAELQDMVEQALRQNEDLVTMLADAIDEKTRSTAAMKATERELRTELRLAREALDEQVKMGELQRVELENLRRDLESSRSRVARMTNVFGTLSAAFDALQLRATEVSASRREETLAVVRRLQGELRVARDTIADQQKTISEQVAMIDQQENARGLAGMVQHGMTPELAAFGPLQEGIQDEDEVF
ncbi:hypothetical protein C8Q76DRAFT_7449 [Earliella scabrosa]|nr:hypothetical protein C8Q76DRAFT_7449 [Earliella scabrosa]